MLVRRVNHLKRRKSFIEDKVNILGIVILLIVGSSLIPFYLQKQQEKIVASYCGDFGIYGKSLVLLKNGDFGFHYWGCSQSYGHIKGTWKSNQNYLELDYQINKVNEGLLDFSYKIKGDELLSSALENDGFTLCK
jgi:hypothetical protein